MSKHVFVTGASAGIGLEIVKAIGKLPGFTVWALVRDLAKGKDAVRACAAEGSTVKLWPAAVDLESPADVERLKADLVDWEPVFALVNNAGFAYHGDAFGAEEARKTIAVNLTGTMAVTDAVLPCLLKAVRSGEDAPRIINICSVAGRLGIVSPALQTRFSRPDATPADVVALAEEFISAVAAGDYAAKGWPKSMYGVSKLAETAYTFCLARQLAPAGIVVHAVCPGHCATNMSSYTGSRTPAKGAETPVWLVTRPESGHPVAAVTGGLWRDMGLLAW